MLVTQRALRRSFASTPSSFIRVISERSISRGWDGAVTRAMEGVQDRVKQQPGLVTYETLVDTADPDKHVVSTVWESKAHLEAWLADPWYIAKCEEFDELLHDDATYDIFVLPREEQFLL